MKIILSVLLIGLSLSLCNLSERFKKGSTTSGSSGSSGASESSSGAAERGQATEEQAATIAGGQEIKWDRQGMSFTVPANWTEETNESKMFVVRSPGASDAATLIVSISPMDENFPTDSAMEAAFDQARSRAKNGEVDEVKWIEIDGLKGVQFREINPERGDDIRRLQWMAYRKYTGQVQLVSVMLASQGQAFSQHQPALYAILYSTKVKH